jgi:hypothetical protein
VQPLSAGIQRATASPSDTFAQAQPSPGFSARYYRLLAKVEEATAATTQSEHTIQTESPPEGLERHQHLSVRVEQEAFATRSAPPLQPTEINSRYERLLAKVQEQEKAVTSRPVIPAAPQPMETMSRYERLLARVREQEQATR